MGETTEIIRRRVRHWKTTLAGVALMSAPVAVAIWPEHTALIQNIVAGLAGAGLMAAADASPKTDKK
jgi:hypothetical protein